MPFRYGNPQMGWAGGLVAFLVFLVFIAVVLWIVFIIARERGHRHGHAHGWEPRPSQPSSDALKILNERFARGEIDAAEYTERRDLLKGSS